MMKSDRKEEIRFDKRIWCIIRFYQSLKGMSDEELADCLRVTERTLKKYDSFPQSITLEMVSDFLAYTQLDIVKYLSL